MNIRRQSSIATLLVAVFAAATAVADTYNLRGPAPKADDTVRTEHSMVVSGGTINMSAGGMNISGKMELDTRSVTEMIVMEVDGDQIVKLRKKFVSDRTEQVLEIMGQPQRTNVSNPLNGTSVVGTLKDGSWSFEMEGASPSREQRQQLESLAGDQVKKDLLRGLYPDRKVRVGETWEVSPELVQAMFGGTDGKGTVKLTLDKVEQSDGETFAHLTADYDFVLNVSEPGMENGTLTIKAKGPVVRSLTKFIDTVDLKGSMEMKMAQGDDMLMTMTGPMTMKSKETRP